MQANKPEKSKHIPVFSIDVSLNFGSQILVFLLASATGVIVSRILGPQGKGVYTLAITIPTIIAFILNMGIDSANIYFIGKKTYPIGAIAGNAFLYSLFFGTAAAVLLGATSPLLQAYFLKGVPDKAMAITILLIPIMLISQNIYYILLGYRKIKQLAFLSVSRGAVYLILLLVFHHFFHLSVYEAIYSYILALAAFLSLGMYFLIKAGYLSHLSLDKYLFISSLKFGIKQHLGAVAQLLNYRLDLLIIAAFLEPARVGLYSVAVLVGESVWYISRAVSQVLYPKTTASKSEEADKFTPIVCRNAVFLTLIAVIFLFLISDYLIPFAFTPLFSESIVVLKLLLPGIFSLSIARILGSDLTGRGFPEYSSLATGISLVLTIILDLLLIPRFGINGAAVASSIAYTVSAVIVLAIFRKKSGVKISQILIVRVSDIVIYKRMFALFKRGR